MASSTGSKTKSSRNTASPKTGARSTNKKATAAKRKTTETADTMDGAILYDIMMIALFAVVIILFLCNFGIIGPVGNAISSMMFGLFGLLAYVTPLLLFVGIAFGTINQGSFIARRKLVAGTILFVLLGVVCELITGTLNKESVYNLGELYKRCAETRSGGGVLAGSVAFALYHFLAMAGTILVILVVGVICFVIVTDKSFVDSVVSGSQKVMERTRDDADRRRERAMIRREEMERRREELSRKREQSAQQRRLKEEEKENAKVLRMDKKVSGVMLDTSLKTVHEEAGRDDIHEITLDGIQDFEKIHIHTSQPVPVEEGGYEEDYGEYRDYRSEEYPAGGFEGDMHEFTQEDYGYDGDGIHECLPDDRLGYSREKSRDSVSEEQYDYVREDAQSFGEQEVFHGSLREDIRGYGQENRYDYMEEEAQEDIQEEDYGPMQEEDWGYGQERTQGYLTGFGQEYEAEDGGMEDSRESPEDYPEPFETARMGEQREEAAAPGTAGMRNRPAAKPAEKPKVGNVADAQMLSGMDAAPKKVPKKYMFPPLSRLQKGAPVSGDSVKLLKETAMQLQQTLATFGVRVTITDISQGPSVTRYELQPEQGVKVSKIVGLTDDIKLNLAATDIRIEAPIPGKAAVGIEVPNKENSPVALRDLLESKEFKEFDSDLAFAVGKDIAGKTVVADIAKMPHMLIAGSTGSGKSVCINTLIMSILYKAHPDDVKLIMVDPKVVELSVYNGIPHLMIPVVTDPKKAAAALQWGVAEMTERYKKFADLNVRNLKGYNKKVEGMQDTGEGVPAKMPQIVIIVDELADLMMVAAGEVEEAICRLAQLARAAGIHLIIATQRPSVDVITGLIKANMPSRVAFAVSSSVDSRTILDMSGAEKLLGKGDMLFYPQGYPKPARVQGSFVSDKEVSDVVDFLKNQTLGNTYSEDIEERIQTMGSTGAGGGGASERDQYFEEAARFIIDKDKASIGMLQRMFKVGFNRAARIMDQLCDAGVVGEEEGTKPRKVLMSMEQFEQYLEEY